MTNFVMLILLGLIQAQPSFAQNSSSVEAEKDKVFSMRVSVGHSTSLYDYQDGTKASTIDFSFVPSFKFSKTKTLNISLAGSQDLIDSERSGIADISMSMGLLSAKLGNVADSGFTGVAIIPTSKDSLVRQEMQGALGLVYGLQLNPDLLFSKNLGLSASVSATALFHKYETAVDGSVNNKYSSKQTIAASYSLSKLSMEISFIHRNAWSYFGSLKEAFVHAEELGYQFNKQFAMSLGHTLEGSIFKANGVDSNIKFIDDNNSIVYGALSYVY